MDNSGPAFPSPAVKLISAERARQLEVEGWTLGHDQQHDCNELARAAQSYLGHYIGRSWVIGTPNDDYGHAGMPDCWPWDGDSWKPKEPIRDLVRAAALIAAEIDRLMRNEQVSQACARADALLAAQKEQSK